MSPDDGRIAAKLELPDCATPRPGEDVVLYQGATRFVGVFHGYDVNDNLLIKHQMGGIIPVKNYIQVRLANPSQRAKACWIDLPECARIEDATLDQKRSFDELLSERLSPGPRYIDFVHEIWARGYEVFLVGGSVRDVLQGESANDVDLVTSMPFGLLESLVTAMFGARGFSRSRNNGFMSVGQNAGNSDASRRGTTIDLKNFFLFAPGTDRAEFGSDLYFDHRLRDFACNAIYYDPINSRFIDPSGIGIEDAMTRSLNLVNDLTIEHPIYKKASIGIRYFKFIVRGYTPSANCIDGMTLYFKPLVKAMTPLEAELLLRRLILSKSPEDEHIAIIDAVRAHMKQYGFEDVWNALFRRLDDLSRKIL